MADPKKAKTQAQNQAKQNVLESLKDLGQGVAKDAVAQVMGTPEPYKKPQNEITNSMELRFIAEQKRIQMMIALERQQREDEKRLSQEKLGQLRMKLQALIIETQKAMVASQEFAQKAQEAIYNIPEKVGEYHLNFLQNFLNYITEFSKDIGSAAVWLSGFGGRKEKKTFMNIFKNKKKGGAGYLLSGEHYVQRSAG
jgi:DNA polymerase III delta prime subunit